MSTLQRHLEQGREKLGRGDYQGALGCADAALAQEAASFEALQLRSRALYLLGRDAEALQTLRQARVVLQQMMPARPEHDPTSPPPDHAGFGDSAVFGEDALETLLALRERHRLDPDLLALLAELAEDAGRYEIAREAYEELVEREPTRLDAWEGLVHVLSHEDLDAALGAIERAQALFPTHPLFHEFLGFIRYRRQQFRLAVAAYRQAMACGACHPDNYQSLAQCYLALHEPESALQMARELAEHHPDDVEAHRFGVEISLDCGSTEMALQHAHQLVRLQPTHAETYSYKAWVEVIQGDWAAAERSLRLGFHKAADGAFALFELVDTLIDDGDQDAALRVADLAYELAPDHPESSASRGKVFREMGAFHEALLCFRQAAALAPQDDAYQTWIGVILDNMGEFQDALRQYNHVLARHPADVWTLCNRGLTYVALGLSDRAMADFSRGIEIDPQDAVLYFWRACAHVATGDHPAALSDLRRAVDLSEEVQGWLDHEPLLDPLRTDPRFRALVPPEEDDLP